MFLEICYSYQKTHIMKQEQAWIHIEKYLSVEGENMPAPRAGWPRKAVWFLRYCRQETHALQQKFPRFQRINNSASARI